MKEINGGNEAKVKTKTIDKNLNGRKMKNKQYSPIKMQET